MIISDSRTSGVKDHRRSVEEGPESRVTRIKKKELKFNGNWTQASSKESRVRGTLIIRREEKLNSILLATCNMIDDKYIYISQQWNARGGSVGHKTQQNSAKYTLAVYMNNL
jgi:hypothetical protein